MYYGAAPYFDIECHASRNGRIVQTTDISIEYSIRCENGVKCLWAANGVDILRNYYWQSISLVVNAIPDLCYGKSDWTAKPKSRIKWKKEREEVLRHPNSLFVYLFWLCTGANGPLTSFHCMPTKCQRAQTSNEYPVLPTVICSTIFRDFATYTREKG